MLFPILLIPFLLILAPVSTAKIITADVSGRILVKLRNINLGLAVNTVFPFHPLLTIVAGVSGAGSIKIRLLYQLSYRPARG